jgi:Tat protein secretion system quality control protein TatD with DNase activity
MIPKKYATYQNTRVGDKIRFRESTMHWFTNRIENAKKLVSGQVYTVKKISVASSSTGVILEETNEEVELTWFDIIETPLIEEDDAPYTYVKESSIEGFGLYASKDFVKGELIIDYKLFPENWYEMKYIDLSEKQIRKNWYVMIDGESCITSDKFSKFSYINHSRNPNCFWDVDKRIISANKDIKVNEELFIDYRLEPRPNRVEFPNWI